MRTLNRIDGQDLILTLTCDMPTCTNSYTGDFETSRQEGWGTEEIEVVERRTVLKDGFLQYDDMGNVVSEKRKRKFTGDCCPKCRYPFFPDHSTNLELLVPEPSTQDRPGPSLPPSDE